MLLIVLVPLTCLSIVASTVTVWSHRTLLDTDRWVATVVPLLDDPRITGPLSSYLADQLLSTLRFQQRVEEALPAQAAFLAAPLANSATRLIQTEMAKVLDSDAGQSAWTNANRIAHERLVAALRSDSPFTETVNGMVTLDLLSLTTAMLERMELAAPGLIPRRGASQSSTSRQSPDERRRDLAQALGVQLPADFGQVPLFPADQLDAARRALRLYDALVIGVPIMALVLVVVTLLVARDRWLVALVLSVGTMGSFVLVRMLMPDAIGLVAAQVSGPVARDVVTATLGILFDRLAAVLTLGAVLGGIASLGTLFMVWTNRKAEGKTRREAELATTP
jgi:hypothetical protein